MIVTSGVGPSRTAARAVGLVVVSVALGVCTLLYPGESPASGVAAGPSAAVTPPVPPSPGSGARAYRLSAGPTTASPSATASPTPTAPTMRYVAGTPSPSARPVAPAVPGAVPCPAERHEGWLRAENALRGEPFLVPSGRGSASVLGYPDRPSATCGDTVGVSLSGTPGTVQLVAYRIGHYGGAGARAVWRSAPTRVVQRQDPSGTAYPHVVEPRWPRSVALPIDGRWTPGFYLLVPVGAPGTARAGRPVGPLIPLTIRDDLGLAPVVFDASTLTWGAYNEWGNWSLYHGPTGSGAVTAAGRARVVSLRRPLIGSGYGQMLNMDLPVVRQLEEIGLDVSYTTDEDVDAQPASLFGHGEVVFGGHSEYWTRGMYDAMLATAASGTNLVFLGANNLWWQARLERSPGAATPDRLAVYRVAADDPAAKTDRSAATILWGSLGRDPAAVLGQSHAAIGVYGGLQVRSAPDWLLAGSGLTDGSVLAGAVGNEADGYNVRATNPATTQVLLAGVVRGANGPATVTSSYSTMTSGAAVFAAGTTFWACIPSGRCFTTDLPPATVRAVGALTRNIVLTFAQPRAALTHPSTPTLPFTPAELLPSLAPGAIGHYGSGTPEKAKS